MRSEELGVRNRVNKKILLCSLLFALCSFASASGNKDEGDKKPINNEWYLCVTQFDFSMLQPAQRIAGQVITKSLVDTFKTVSYRLRVSPEYAYYEDYAWRQAVNAAAKALAQKQDERSLLLFKGEPNWRYRKNLKKIDAEIKKLEEELAKKIAEKPTVNNEPVFKLVQANLNGNFPEPPKPGRERRFAQEQKADAFLVGSVREFHGRFFITLKLYVLYANAFVYEDDIIFSMDDAAGAVDEITGRLTAVLSGNKPAVIAIKTDPPEAQVLINGNFAGRGAVEEREHPPGKITVAVSADGYTPELVETDLVSGKITEIDVSLSSLLYSHVNIATPGFTGVSIYNGALYVGEAPYNLLMPIDTLGYITAETKERKAAKIVFTAPAVQDESYNISLKLKNLPESGQKRVNKARSQYYWAWGITWVAAMLAWGANGVYSSQRDVLPNSSSREFWNNTNTWSYINNGSLILLGTAAAYNVFQLSRYLYISTEGSTPIARRGKK
jgi:hypothetical protein